MIEVRLIQASQSELKNLIAYSYEGDTDLIEKYQAGDRTFEECVDYNYEEILSKMKDPVFAGDMYIWKVCLQSGDEVNDIGYCVTVKNEGNLHWLYSFAINIHYRKSVFLIGWLKEVEKMLGVPYYTALWNNNTRAIEFFKKNNFTEKANADHPFTYLFKGFDLIPKKQRKQWRLH